MKRALALALAVALLIGLGFVVTCVYTVSQTQQVALVEFGKPVGLVTKPGLYLKSPLQKALYFDRRLLNLEAQNQDVITLDNKHVEMDVTVRWRIADPLLFSAQQDFNIAADNLKSLLSSNMRDVLGAEKFAVLLSDRRPALMAKIRDRLSRDARPFGVEIADVRLRRDSLPKEDAEAVYLRMKKELESLANQNRAQGDEIALGIKADADRQVTEIKAGAMAEAAVIKGEGDAERIKVTAAAAGQDPQFYAFWRTMQAYTEALPASNTTIVLSPKSEFLKYFGDGPGGAGKKK
jgi:modulator of FtsH protease HflC